MGRHRVVGGGEQDHYTQLLTRVRGEYAAQLTTGELLTARHGRHVISSTAAQLVLASVAPRSALPHWGVTGAAAALGELGGQGDPRLGSSLTAQSRLSRSAYTGAL